MAITFPPTTENAFPYPSNPSGYVGSRDTALCTLTTSGEHKFHSSCKKGIKTETSG